MILLLLLIILLLLLTLIKTQNDAIWQKKCNYYHAYNYKLWLCAGTNPVLWWILLLFLLLLLMLTLIQIQNDAIWQKNVITTIPIIINCGYVRVPTQYDGEL